MRAQNLSALMLDAISRSVEINADLATSNQAELRSLSVSHPALMVIVADVMVRLHRKMDLLDRIRLSFRHRKPDLISVSQLIEDDRLIDVDPDSVNFAQTKISFPEQNLILLEFIARRMNRDMEVLRVETFVCCNMLI